MCVDNKSLWGSGKAGCLMSKANDYRGLSIIVRGKKVYKILSNQVKHVA